MVANGTLWARWSLWGLFYKVSELGFLQSWQQGFFGSSASVTRRHTLVIWDEDTAQWSFSYSGCEVGLTDCEKWNSVRWGTLLALLRFQRFRHDIAGKVAKSLKNSFIQVKSTSRVDGVMWQFDSVTGWFQWKVADVVLGEPCWGGHHPPAHQLPLERIWAGACLRPKASTQFSSWYTQVYQWHLNRKRKIILFEAIKDNTGHLYLA